MELVFVEEFVTVEWSSVAPARPGGVSSLPNIKPPPPFVPAQKSALLRSFPGGPRKTLFGGNWGMTRSRTGPS